MVIFDISNFQFVQVVQSRQLLQPLQAIVHATISSATIENSTLLCSDDLLMFIICSDFLCHFLSYLIVWSPKLIHYISLIDVIALKFFLIFVIISPSGFTALRAPPQL